MLTDEELRTVRHMTGLMSREMWAYLYGFILVRTVDVDEVSDAHTRLYEAHYREHPEDRPTTTLADITRSETINFRRQPR